MTAGTQYSYDDKPYQQTFATVQAREMPKEKVDGFPVFARYAWSGPSVEQLFADAPPVGPGVSNMEERERYFAQKEVSAVLKRARVVQDSSRIAERFDAEDRPSLFLELAEVEVSPAGILGFAGRNGLLGSEGNDGDSAFGFIGERSVVRGACMWLWILRHDWSEPLGIESLQVRSDARRQDIIEDAAQHLRELVNARLAAATPSLDCKMRLTAVAPRLIEAVWFQIAKAIDSGRKINRCLRCGKFFEVAGGTSRTDRAYCNNACRLAAYRARKQLAAALHSQGLTVREIAKQLRSDVETVKGWIEEKGE